MNNFAALVGLVVSVSLVGLAITTSPVAGEYNPNKRFDGYMPRMQYVGTPTAEMDCSAATNKFYRGIINLYGNSSLVTGEDPDVSVSVSASYSEDGLWTMTLVGFQNGSHHYVTFVAEGSISQIPTTGWKFKRSSGEDVDLDFKIRIIDRVVATSE